MLYHAPNNLTQYKCRCTDLLMWNTFFTFLFITKKKNSTNNQQPVPSRLPFLISFEVKHHKCSELAHNYNFFLPSGQQQSYPMEHKVNIRYTEYAV